METPHMVFTLPPFRVVGTPVPLAAWENIKDKTLEELFGSQLDKIRVTVVMETPLLVAPTKGEQDETAAADTDAGD